MSAISHGQQDGDLVVGVDEIAGTFPLVGPAYFDESPQDVLGILCSWLEEMWGSPFETDRDSPDKKPWGAWDRRRSFGEGIDVLWSSNGKYCYLRVSGAGFRRMQWPELQNLIVTLRSLPFKPTRIDPRMDDFSADRMMPKAIYDQHVAVDPELWSGFKKKQLIGCDREGEGLQTSGGWTLQLGSNSESSDGFIRIYDKDAESKGVLKCVRWEYQMRGTAALEMWNKMKSCTDQHQLMKCLGGAITGKVNFYLERDVAHGQRGARYAYWWMRILERLRKSQALGPSG